MSNASVIIRTYTEARWTLLLSTVRSLREQTCPPMEILIVVDHNQALQEKVKAALPWAVVVPNQESGGSSGAWNSGIKAARGEILAFIDDDATAAPDWLEQLELGYVDSKVIGVGGDIMPVWLDARPKWFPEEFYWVVGCTYRGLTQGKSGVRNLIGCNMSFRRTVFESVGYFRGAQIGIGHLGAVPIGCDETELCIRTRQQWPDSVLVHRPEAKVMHSVPATRTTFKYFRSRCYYEGRSKARVSQIVGRRDGLASERAHILRVLPRGVIRGLRDLAMYRDAAGLGRAAAIVAGLSWATAGYLSETLATRRVSDSRTGKTYHTPEGDRAA